MSINLPLKFLSSTTHLSPLAFKIFLFLYALPRNTKHNEVKTDFPSIRRALNLADKHQNNLNIIDAIDELKEWVTIKDFRTLRAEYESATFPLLSSISVIKTERKNAKRELVFELSKKVLEIDTTKNFLPFEVEFLKQFKSAYGLRLFLMLYAERFRNNSKIELKNDYLAELLSLPKDTPPSIVQRRIANALKEIDLVKHINYFNVIGFIFDKKRRCWQIEWHYLKKQNILQPSNKKQVKNDIQKNNLLEFVKQMRDFVKINKPNGIVFPSKNGQIILKPDGYLWEQNGKYVKKLITKRAFKAWGVLYKYQLVNSFYIYI